MKLGIGLPNTLAYETDRKLMLDWARLADEAGFYCLATIDKPKYGRLWTEPENLIHQGPPSKIADDVQACADARIDVLILFPEVPGLDQVERLAEEVLPAYR